jgi:acetyl-CoA carboxylase biotin carboxyl carrier protein
VADLQVRSPGAGRVIEVLVAVGAPIAEGDELIVVESMKMEIPVVAERTGTVAQLHVAVGAVVSEGSVLVTLR